MIQHLMYGGIVYKHIYYLKIYLFLIIILMKIIICIIIYETDIHKINVICNTYFKLSDNIQYYFITDVKSSNDIFIFLDNINTIHFDIIKYFDSSDYDFMLITYVDAFVNIPNLIKLLETLDINEPLYIGGHGDYRTINNTKFWFHSYSPGIVLNKLATKLLLNDNLMNDYNQLLNNELINLSGVALGYYAHKFNIKCINNPYFYYCNWKGKPCHSNINNSNIICCYNMSKEDMYDYYRYINNYKKVLNGMNIIICPGGGLGNLLFQYFLGYSLSKQYNCTVHYQINYNYWRGDINKYKIFEHLNFIDLDASDTSSFLDYNEPNFFYNPVELKEENYKIFGYYQSYKYSEKYINEIRNELFFNVATTYFNMETKYYSLKNDKPTCLVHVRRGDYLMYHNVHPTLRDEYYIEALSHIPNCKYLIFSDDINFIKSWNVIKNIDYEIIDLNDSEELLILMSLCDNFIIANSTLSLAAYLLRKNKDAKLVGPKIWFGDAGYKYKIEDIIPSSGLLI